jgi:hypothetical protein
MFLKYLKIQDHSPQYSDKKNIDCLRVEICPKFNDENSSKTFSAETEFYKMDA